MEKSFLLASNKSVKCQVNYDRLPRYYTKYWHTDLCQCTAQDAWDRYPFPLFSLLAISSLSPGLLATDFDTGHLLEHIYLNYPCAYQGDQPIPPPCPFLWPLPKKEIGAHPVRPVQLATISARPRSALDSDLLNPKVGLSKLFF